MTSPVTIHTPDDLALAGVLRRPESDAPDHGVGIVLTGPFTGVKEQVVAVYAEGLAARGYTTLAFDHRNFGASEGTPRQQEDSGGKLNDLAAAVTHLAGLDGVDRIGCVGICLGAGYALKATAFDPRIEALVTVAGAYNSPQAMRAGFGEAAYTAKLRELATAGAEIIPAVAESGAAGMPGAEPFAYYGTERGSVPGWRNEVTLESIRQLLIFDAMMAADFVSPTPVRIVHGTQDDYCGPDAAHQVFDRLNEPRDLVWIETTNHIDLYDVAKYVDPALDACADWFDRHLVSRGD